MVENHVYVSHSRCLCPSGCLLSGPPWNYLGEAFPCSHIGFSLPLSKWTIKVKSIRHHSACKSWSRQASGEHWPPTNSLRFSHLITFASLWNQWMNQMSKSTWPLSVCSWSYKTLLPQMMDYRPMKPHVAWRLSAFVLGRNNSRELSSQNRTAPENKRFPVLYYGITVKPEALAHSTIHLLVGCHQMFEKMHRHVHYTCSC